MRKTNFLWIAAMTMMIIAAAFGTGYAKVTGACVNCHTMHNSQDGAVMATFGGETGPNGALVRGSCIGCHGQGGANHIITEIPQVLHSGATDLAGGNFGYITADKALTTGTVASVGHNVIDLAVAETDLDDPPGDENATGIKAITGANFTCAGVYGCHGDRSVEGNFAAISGAHHGGVSGKCDTASTVANSYRFLLGVKGFENMDATYKYQNYSSQYHNEYYGVVGAAEVGGSGTAPANNSISGLCAECHGNFHGSTDIGGATTPFTRHPTDIVLPNKTEYAGYTGATYSVQAPVARPAVPAVINTLATNDTVTPGTDVVMCLSCHGVHATAYEDILRWNYTGMLAETSGATKDTGCFVCHTTKDSD